MNRQERAKDIVYDRINHPELTYQALAEKRPTPLADVQRAIAKAREPRNRRAK